MVDKKGESTELSRYSPLAQLAQEMWGGYLETNRRMKMAENDSCFKHLNDIELYNLSRIIYISMDKGLNGWFLDNLSEHDQVRLEDAKRKTLKKVIDICCDENLQK